MLEGRRLILGAEIPTLVLLIVVVFVPVVRDAFRVLLILFLGGFLLEKGVLFKVPPFMTRYAGLAIPGVILILIEGLVAFTSPGDYVGNALFLVYIPLLLLAWLVGVGTKRLLWRWRIGLAEYRIMFSTYVPQADRLRICVFGTLAFGFVCLVVATLLFGPDALADNIPLIVLVVLSPVLVGYECAECGIGPSEQVPGPLLKLEPTTPGD